MSKREDPRLLFLVRELHCMVTSGLDLESIEVQGLKMVLEQIIIDGRENHDGLQKIE